LKQHFDWEGGGLATPLGTVIGAILLYNRSFPTYILNSTWPFKFLLTTLKPSQLLFFVILQIGRGRLSEKWAFSALQNVFEQHRCY